MIVFDFEILRETDLDNVTWQEIGAAPFYYSCFLGDIVFEVDDVDLSARWGWVPVFDFAFQMRRVAARSVLVAIETGRVSRWFDVKRRGRTVPE